MTQPLKILLIEPDTDRASDISHALKQDGWAEVIVRPNADGLAGYIQSMEPDGVLIDMLEPTADELKMISLASDASHRPVVLFVDRSGPDLTKAAVDVGLSGYVVNGLQKDRVKPVLQTAMARFDHSNKLRSELVDAKRALSDRKTIDKAKGLLMSSKSISEQEAYDLLRKTAMDQGRKMIDVAQALVTTADLLG